MILGQVSLTGILAASALIGLLVSHLLVVARKVGKLTDIEVQKAFGPLGYTIAQRSAFPIPLTHLRYKILLRHADGHTLTLAADIRFSQGIWGIGAAITLIKFNPPPTSVA